ncbi:UPF0488 protein C8orf33 homolog [Dendropsophus ebraccatus]|uniref:UPF0488 protein C8orf33 homolog n=1 Tax=Dendropsophus ebraccatus TaxID=150705 RepID=UPI003831FA22
MEEAPKGTFEDELEWCIQKLETGLLRHSPTPTQVAEAQRILQLLRSRKAPFVKKRRVMSQVFGNYRLKMAEERRAQEQAANNPPEATIQQVTARDIQSVAYRKSSKDVQSGAGPCITRSSGDFTFNFFPEQEHQDTEGRPEEAMEGHTNPQVSQEGRAVCLDGGPEFTFNFQMTDEACCTSEVSVTPLSTHDSLGDHSGRNHTTPAVAHVSLSQACSSSDNAARNSRDMADQTDKAVEENTAESPKKKKKKKSKNVSAQSKVEEGRGITEPGPHQEEEPKGLAEKKSKSKNVTAQAQSKVVEDRGSTEPGPHQEKEPKVAAKKKSKSKNVTAQAQSKVEEGRGSTEPGPHQEKEPKVAAKKKSKSKNVTAQAQSKMEEGRGSTEPGPHQEEEPKSGAEELRRELDWCVEQLEIGLQRQKSTAKQVEEALRAIKTLRSEKVPLVKKRQVMRVMFGDYRHKMEEERIKQLRLMQAAAKSAKMTEVTATARQNSSKVFRKSNHTSSRSAAPSLAAPADAQGSSDTTTGQSPATLQGFTFTPSQEAFCFNFF